MKIIYQTVEVLAIIIPTGEIDINEVARKDVPAGVDYWIIEDTDIPTDRTFRNAWKQNSKVIETDMTKKDGSKLLDRWIESIPLKKAGKVSDVSELCLFLASEKATYITGQVINVDGGLVT